MMVSAMLARVFMVYFTVVRDFWEMLASTYLFAPIPQKVILQRGNEEVSVYCTCHWTAGGVLTSKTIYTQLLYYTIVKLQLTKKILNHLSQFAVYILEMVRKK